MMTIEIRPVDDKDLDAILGVYRQCEDFLALGPQPHASAEMVMADLELSRHEGGVFCGIYVNEYIGQQGTMIGVVDFVPAGFEGAPQQAFLALLMIAQPYRGQGVGAQVVQRVEQVIRRNPEVRSVCSGVQVNNPAAIRFWQKMGYRIVGEPETFPDQTTAYPLRKDLDDENGYQ